MIERHDIINHLTERLFSNYLEIGVDAAYTINKVKINNKTGVDPCFKVPLDRVDALAIEKYSDEFFFDNKEKFECIFIDGLHTYEQSKRDFLNAAKSLKRRGIIIMDDCDPADELAALPDLMACLEARRAIGRADDMTWMGDVYKTILWIHDFTKLPYAYVDGAIGVVVIWGGKVERPRLFTSAMEIERCSFETFKSLNLPKLPLKEIRKRVERFEWGALFTQPFAQLPDS